MEKQIRQTYFEGERPLFGAEHLSIQDTIFGEGESPLKESSDISLEGSIFQWKYQEYCRERRHMGGNGACRCLVHR